MMQKIITALGLGRFNQAGGKYEYDRVKYCWEGQAEVETTLIQEVWGQWFPDAQVLVLATEKARLERQGDLERHPRWKVVDIPDGKNESEFWGIYEQVAANLDEGDEVILDITHGFRSLPVLILLAASFLRSAKGIAVKHVLYGAYEAKSGDQTPVLDLAPFLTLLDWAGATNRFLETGDASKFRPLTETRGTRPLNTHLNSAVKDLDGLSEALSTNRAMRGGELSSKALAKIEQATMDGAWEPSHAPLKLLLPRLKQGLGLLARDVRGSQQDQLVQSFGQVRWFLRHRQYEKALGLTREWMVSFAQWKLKGTWLPVELAERERTEGWLWGCEKDKTPAPEGWADFIVLWRNLGHLRNDLLHFGFRDAARKESAIPDEVTEKIKQLRAAVLPLGLELPEPL